jgi:hypothetical protein
MLTPSLIIQAADPTPPPMPNITPTYGNEFPFVQTLLAWASDIQGTALIILGILFIFGVCMLVSGKLSGGQTMTRVGYGSLITAIVGAALVAGAFRWMGWGSEQRLINDAQALAVAIQTYHVY